MRVPRLLVFDLDGTLLDSRHQIPDSTLNLLLELRSLDVGITLATGRPFAAVRSFAQQLDLELPLVVFNGAAIVTPRGQSLSLRPLPTDSAIGILGLLAHTSACNQVYLAATDNHFLTDQPGSASEYITEKDGLECLVLEDLRGALDEAKSDPVKLFSIGERAELEAIQQQVKLEYPEISCVFSEHDMLEFLGPSVNKGTALEILCNEIGVSMEGVCAFGDNMNDYEMLMRAGTGVAMASSPRALKEDADCVVESIDAMLRVHLSALKGGETVC